jgi:beta-lactamase regulating signal transducer with metallopeptidase domain
MFELMAVCLSLTGLLVIDTLACLLVALIWRITAKQAESWLPATRAGFLFFLRIAPALAAVLCVGALFIPAYLSHEPRQTNEVVTAKMGLLAALSLYGISLALWRAGARYLVTRRLIRNWMEHAIPVRIENVSIPAFRLRHAFPVIAIVGAVRPKLFIADQIFESLEAEEISAALAHENGHLTAGDNLKRGLLRWCKDFLGFLPLGCALDHAWADASELAADEYAARRGAAVALDLASALVKVARMAPIGLKPIKMAGVSLIAQDPGRIQMRVLRLTRLASRAGDLPEPGLRVPKLAIAACISGATIALSLILLGSDLLITVHSALECVVSALQ